ncbi:hypothetical protein ABKV19_013284 [Rosa sericea]
MGRRRRDFESHFQSVYQKREGGRTDSRNLALAWACRHTGRICIEHQGMSIRKGFVVKA